MQSTELRTTNTRTTDVQSFGFLFGFSDRDFTIEFCSTNASNHTGRDRHLGDSLVDCLANPDLIHDIRGAMGLPTIDHFRERLGSHRLGGKDFDVALHRSGGKWIVEFEQNFDPRARPDRSFIQVQSMMSAIRSRPASMPMLQSAVQMLRGMTGYDHVMAVKFQTDDVGETETMILAEASRRDAMPLAASQTGLGADAKTPIGANPLPLASCQGQPYPVPIGSVYPHAAMLRMPFRCLADASAESVCIESIDPAKSLDLTMTHLRAFDDQQVHSIRQLGVRSVMQLPIIVDQHVWGMLALHHHRPLLLPPAMRITCEWFCQMISFEI